MPPNDGDPAPMRGVTVQPIMTSNRHPHLASAQRCDLLFIGLACLAQRRVPVAGRSAASARRAPGRDAEVTQRQFLTASLRCSARIRLARMSADQWFTVLTVKGAHFFSCISSGSRLHFRAPWFSGRHGEQERFGRRFL